MFDSSLYFNVCNMLAITGGSNIMAINIIQYDCFTKDINKVSMCVCVCTSVVMKELNKHNVTARVHPYTSLS